MTSAIPASSRPSRGKSQIGETQMAASVVIALHRLVKQSTLYTTENEAQRRQLDQTQRAVMGYGRRTGKNPRIYFTERSVFVGGRLLRAGRGIYDAALELGRLLARFGIDEVTIGYDVTVEELRRFQHDVGEALRKAGGPPSSQAYERIRLRRGSPPLASRAHDRASPEEQIIRGYATSIVVMRRFLERLQAGDHRLPARVRRLAEQLADLSAIESPAFLASIALYNARYEHAGRAVNAALVAMGMARQLSDERPLLARIALAALLYDVGIPRVAGTGPLGDERIGLAMPRLGEEQLGELPAAAASVVTALGGLSKVSKAVAVLVFEALALAHRDHAPPLYDGERPPTFEARIVAVARRFTALVSDPDDELNADQALVRLRREARDDADQTALRLLMSALGIYPTSTLVELDDGTIAQVVAVPDDVQKLSFPIVRPIVDASGATKGGLVDLARGERRIVRIVGVADERDDPDPANAPNAPHATSAPSAATTPVDPEEDHEAVAIELAADEETVDGGPRQTAEPVRDEPDEPDFPSDDDDVPSMVLQAIVDGRRGHDEPERPLGALFFGDRDETASEATPSPPPPAPAPPPSPTPPRPSPVVPPPHRAMSRATPLGSVSRGTPLRGIERGKTALGIRRGKSLRGTPRGVAPDELAPRSGGGAPAKSSEPAASTPRPRTVTDPAAPAPTRSEPSTPAPQSAPIARDRAETSGEHIAPTAQGLLGKTPLVHLLVYTFDRSLSGSLTLDADGAKHVVYFDRGVPAKARTPGTVAPLDQVLLEMSLVDEPTLSQSLAAIAETGELHGRFLVRQGKLDVASVKAALAWQLVRKMSFMLKLPPTTRYAFYADHNLLADYGGPELTPVEPIALIMTGARILGATELVEQTLKRLGPAPLRLRREAAVDKLALKDSERKVVELLRVRALTLQELLAREVTHPQIVRHTIYALLITRYLKLGDQQRPPLGGDRPPIPLTWPGRSEVEAGPVRSEPRRDPSRPGPRRRSSPHNVEAISARTPSRPVIEDAPLPRRGTSSAGPLPRRGTSSSGPLPRRGTSSARGAVVSTRSPLSGTAPPVPPRSVRTPTTPAREPAPSTPKADPVRRPTPPVRSSAAPLDRATIKETATRIQRQNFFEILGLEPSAPPNEVQSTYFQLAKRWHPDRLPAELSDLKPQVSRIFARINEAFQTLSQADRRREYVELVQSGGGTARDREILERAVDSAMLFQKGEVFFKKGDYAQAEFHVRQAVDADPDQPEYRALLAWVQAHRLGPPPAGSSDHYRKQIQLLDDLIAKEPEYERALFYRGTLLMRSGKTDAAIADFRAVMRLNPRNIDAAREVRLYEMRRRENAGEGLLGRLFKKK